jgi:hypothetical protein
MITKMRALGDTMPYHARYVLLFVIIPLILGVTFDLIHNSLSTRHFVSTTKSKVTTSEPIFLYYQASSVNSIQATSQTTAIHHLFSSTVPITTSFPTISSSVATPSVETDLEQPLGNINTVLDTQSTNLLPVTDPLIDTTVNTSVLLPDPGASIDITVPVLDTSVNSGISL